MTSSQISTTNEESVDDTEELRIQITELNKSVAYLSKMVLELQRTIKKNNNSVSSPDSQKKGKTERPKTFH